MLNFLANVNGQSIIAIGILTGIVVLTVAACYFMWAWSEEKGPFKK